MVPIAEQGWVKSPWVAVVDVEGGLIRIHFAAMLETIQLALTNCASFLIGTCKIRDWSILAPKVGPADHWRCSSLTTHQKHCHGVSYVTSFGELLLDCLCCLR